MSTCFVIWIKRTNSANTASIYLNWLRLRLRPIHGHLMMESNNLLGTSEMLLGLFRDSDGLSFRSGSGSSRNCHDILPFGLFSVNSIGKKRLNPKLAGGFVILPYTICIAWNIREMIFDVMSEIHTWHDPFQMSPSIRWLASNGHHTIDKLKVVHLKLLGLVFLPTSSVGLGRSGAANAYFFLRIVLPLSLFPPLCLSGLEPFVK